MYENIPKWVKGEIIEPTSFVYLIYSKMYTSIELQLWSRNLEINTRGLHLMDLTFT